MPSLHTSGLLDTFGSGGVFLAPPSSLFNISENLFVSPTPPRQQQYPSVSPIPTSITVKSGKSSAFSTPVNEDEVTSSAEEIRVDEPLDSAPTYIQMTPSFVPYSKRDAVFEAAAKLLFLAVKWAKSMPSFAQILLKDQTTLLEESWSELFVITAAQYGLAIESEFILSNIL